jgi:hypothetical protein
MAAWVTDNRRWRVLRSVLGDPLETGQDVSSVDHALKYGEVAQGGHIRSRKRHG